MFSTPPPASSAAGTAGGASAAFPGSHVLPDALQALPAEATPTVIRALTDTIEDNLRFCIYPSAIFYAERLFDILPDYRNLHTLASCYQRSADAASACRLLQQYYPFFEPHVTRPVPASAWQQKQPQQQQQRTATVAGAPPELHLRTALFNNANVLYHVRNTQGYSEVARMEHKQVTSGGGGGRTRAEKEEDGAHGASTGAPRDGSTTAAAATTVS